MSAAPRLLPTYADYLELEDRADQRHAWHEGQIFAMAGGSTLHALLSAEVLRILGNGLQGRPCAAVGSDQRLSIDEHNSTYPDGMVLCPPLRRPTWDAQAVANPALVVEVLSPSTEAWDRGGKLELYGRVEGLSEVLLVSQERWQIWRYRREGRGWWAQAHGPGEVVELEGLGLRLSVDEVYARAQAFGGPGPEAAGPRPG